MAMTLEEAMHKIGDLEATNRSLTQERDRLLTHKGELEGDLTKARTAKTEAEAKVTELTDKLPKDGSRVLSKSDGERFDALMDIDAGGKKGDAASIKAALGAGAEAQTKAHRSDTREALRKLGYEPTDRLLKDFDGVSLTVSQGDDKKLVGKVKAGEEEKSFGDWTKAQGLDSDLERYRSQPGGVVVLPQHQGGGNGSVTTTGKIVDELNAARDSRPNPLLKGNTPDGDKNKVLP